MAADKEGDICILCDELLLPENTATVRQRAIQSLVEASLQRKDKKHLQLRQCESLNIHKSCHITYVRKRSIEAAKAASTASTSKARRHSISGQNFDFSTNCFMCGNAAYRQKVGNRIQMVERVDMAETILEALKDRPENDFNSELRFRLSTVNDLCQQEARYHLRCYRQFFNYRLASSESSSLGDTMSAALQHVINYILDNEEDCQFSLKEILSHFTGDLPRIDRLKKQLQDHFEDDIVIYSIKNDALICFRDARNNFLNEAWYTKRATNEEDERKRIVSMAANIVLQDIRARYYDTNNYKAPTSCVDDFLSDIPSSLQLFLDVLIKSHKRSMEKEQQLKKWSNKIATFGHILISSVRPRTFISPLMLGLSSMMHRKHASRCLIDSLASLGLCATYKETNHFEASIASDPDHYSLQGDTFIQFVFDNADHNTNTLDGRNTFHAMGGIMCITPGSAVQSKQTIKKVSTTPSPNVNGQFGFIPVKHFEKGTSLGLNDIVMEDLSIENPISNDFLIAPSDFLWFYGKLIKPLDVAGWSGFMGSYYNSEDFYTSKIIPLPFINNPPSSFDTILTALIEAANKCKELDQKHCFVTFDQPLYFKAREIVASIDPNNDPYNVHSVIIRLGGFHALMSFLGSIGFIMENSGLKEVFSMIYAETSTEKALLGHAYSRAIRGHSLVQLALANRVISSLTFDETEVELLDNILSKVAEENFDQLRQEEVCAPIVNKFVARLETLKNNGPTAQLWLQYFQMVLIAKKFVAAERSGNWDLHMQSMQLMIPYFHSSGHHLYAKSSQLYLQDMLNLKSQMDRFEYDKLCNSGFFTIRRTNKFWAGVWTDMTIEQVLMKSMKTSGGLTHGRGMSESVIATWIKSAVVMTEVCNEMENFCNVSYATSEQHVDARVSRISRDAADLKKILSYFETHDPFPETDCIMSIHSGVVGDENINCYKAFEIGIALQKKNVGEKFGSVKFQRKNKVLSLRAVNSKVKIAGDTVAIDPLLIFQRITLNIKEKSEMRNYLKYELAPFPLSLFDEGGMRKTQKSVFYANFEHLEEIPEIQNVVHVVDGGFLIHRVNWHQNDSVQEILKQYVSYVMHNFAANSVVVFDGYPESNSSGTKFCERSRRKMTSIGSEIIFDASTAITSCKEKFLSNDKNKKRLINLLSKELKKNGYRTKCATEDADLLIVNTAIEQANDDVMVKVVGQDVDLLVLLTQLASNKTNILFEKVNSGGTVNKLYDSNSFKYREVRHLVGFLHAFTGCDTTSCFFKQGKQKLLKCMRASSRLQELASHFYNIDTNPEDLARSGTEIIAAMYAAKGESASLEELRFLHFQKSTLKRTSKLENLPPTEAAGKQHSFRVYHQLQEWLGNAMDATKWGWQPSASGLVPVVSSESLIPEELIKIITCKCTTGCKAACGCRKHGLRCSDLCINCQGEERCTNVDFNVLEIDEDLDEIDDGGVDDVNYTKVECELGENEQSEDEEETILAKRSRLEIVEL